MTFQRMTALAITALLAAPALTFAADGGEKRALMDIHVQEMIWTLVVFIIFFVVLSTVVWPKILGALKAREEKQRTDLKTAESAAKEADATLAEYKQQLAEARAESQSIIEKARKDAEQVAASLKSQTESEIAAMRDRAQADIKSAKEQALAEVYEQMAVVSTQIAGRILQREISTDDQQALVRQSIDALKNAELN